MTAAPPLTQDEGKSQVKYAWVILFHYDIDDPAPFTMVPLSFFAGSDFPWPAVKGILNSEFRSEKRTFSNIPGKEFMIFAKVEIGEKNAILSIYLFLRLRYILFFFNIYVLY